MNDFNLQLRRQPGNPLTLAKALLSFGELERAVEAFRQPSEIWQRVMSVISNVSWVF